MTRYADFYRHSIDNRDAFWGEQAALIDILRRPMAEQVASEGRRKNGWKK